MCHSNIIKTLTFMITIILTTKFKKTRTLIFTGLILDLFIYLLISNI